MCKCINISLMCMCLTTQTERGKWTRDLVVTSRTAAPSCRLLHHSLGANKCTEGEAECKKSLHFSPTKSFTDKRQRVHCTRWLFFFAPVFVGGSIYRRHLKAAAANRTLFQNHQAHFFCMVGGIYVTCTSGLTCICGVEQGIKAREGGGASFQPTAAVHGSHVYLHDYWLQTNSSLF